MSEQMELVMKVLAGQSPDYFIFPNASAFLVEELDPDEVASILAELDENGVVEREQLAEGIGGGYRLRRDT